MPPSEDARAEYWVLSSVVYPATTADHGRVEGIFTSAERAIEYLRRTLIRDVAAHMTWTLHRPGYMTWEYSTLTSDATVRWMLESHVLDDAWFRVERRRAQDRERRQRRKVARLAARNEGEDA